MGSYEGLRNKPHAVCVPYPSQGHVTPMMLLAKLLHSRGFHITFVNTHFNHNRLIRSHGPDAVKGSAHFRFESIPDGLPPSDQDATQHVPSLCDSTRKNCLAPFRDLLAKLNSSAAAAKEGVPPVSCIISDGVMSFAMKAAEEIGVPEVQFWTTSACGMMGYLQFRELVNRGIFPFKDEESINDQTLNMPIDWVPGMKNICLRDLPTFLRTTNPDEIMFNFMGEEAHNSLRSPVLLLNTFDALEQEVLDALVSIAPPIYTCGPLSLLAQPTYSLDSPNPSLWKEDSHCLHWLDERPPNTVMYVNYGSVTVMTPHHLLEFAWGLANSNHPFLWIVRPDIVIGESTTLPEEFFEEIKDRGLLVSWCSQFQVLSHPAIGAFLSHCGWNSMIESISAGVPMIGWPFFAEQSTNCGYANREWRIGMEVNHDVKREEIEALVRELMEGEEGKKMRKRVLEWKKKAKEATSFGGSSYTNFNRFVREALHYEG
ncbi:linamarin synthase 2-like [Malania oleifera]|uniref:linamarin synthase 2-like n=1 Tax=Malania oleifera TaxID=397392 RepID=UPI0025AEA2FC|nr:linamarin synthase 2-like [Malania oleifera]